MTSDHIRDRIAPEIYQLLNECHCLHLSSLTQDNKPYASYAPYAVGEAFLYVLLSELAVHAVNLQLNPEAAVLIIEDESTATDLFARRRVNYRVQAEKINRDTSEWISGIDLLRVRQGKLVDTLSQLGDFKLFRLTPISGRYIKGFGKAFAFDGETLTGTCIRHLHNGQ